VKTRSVENVIAIAKEFGCLPSEVMSIKDEYTAYCFNEACINVLMRIKNKETPHWITLDNGKEKEKSYTNFSDFYKDI
jgi:hypothetical protein